MSVSIIVAKEALETAGQHSGDLDPNACRNPRHLCVRQLAGGLVHGPVVAAATVADGFFLISVAVVTFGGFWLSLLAIDKIDVSIANTLNATEPLFVLPLAAFVLKERITRVVVFGALLTFVGIVLIIAP
jgi:drug/metabolite transporter (DMT)-like permease